MHAYSDLFTLIHEVHRPYSHWMEGHEPCVSIFSTVQWKGKRLERLKMAMIQRFAVIWDKDHDDRIILALNKAYISGLLSPVAAIGESKGNLSIILHAHAPKKLPLSFYDSWMRLALSVDGDEWSVAFGEIGVTACGMLFYNDEAATSYINQIKNKFSLGIQPFTNRYSEYILDTNSKCYPPLLSEAEIRPAESTDERCSEDPFDDDIAF